ncbi:MAG: hypothetical protein KBC33_01490 [Candidatus Pacebacteria bacterium]|nr:hypothetical protein [Candidatus Paceibacterota bacterium]
MNICRINSTQQSGVILIDILVALALGAAFVASVALASSSARSMFETAREREYALDVYEAHKEEFDGMLPHDSRSVTVASNVLNAPDGASTTSFISTTTIEAAAHWYGNDMVETVISILGDSYHMRRAGPIVFNAVRAYPFGVGEEVAGTPLCTVDFARSDLVGSYKYQHPDPNAPVASIVPISLPIDPLVPLMDIEVRNGIAYIASDSAAASDPDLIIVDISNTNDPTLISTINTGPGIASIVLAGDRIFAAAASTAAQLHIIRFESLDMPILEKKYQLTLPYATATPPFASTVFYDDGLIYLGTEKWIGNEFIVIDVSSSTAPIELGGLEIGAKILDIAVREGIAYTAAAGQDQMITVDIQNPQSPIVINKFSPSGWERQEGKSVLTFEESLVFGRTSGGFNIKADHELFTGNAFVDTDPDSSVDIAGGVYGIIADRRSIYAAGRAAGKELVAVDHSLAATSSHSFALPAPSQAMTCDRDRIYILASGAPVIYQVTFK